MVLILLAQKATNKCGKKMFEKKMLAKKRLKTASRKSQLRKGESTVAELLAGQKC